MQLDPVSFEILSIKLGAIGDEMGLALYRSGRTLYVKETGDFATGVADRDGRMVSYPSHIGVASMIDGNLRPVVDAAGPLDPGDVIVTNHPFASGGLSTHLPDIHVVKPYFADGEIVGYGWSFLHSADVGGRVPSSISPSNTELFQEGLSIPPLKLVRAGRLNEDLLAIIRSNCRTAEENIGDIKAMIATMGVGERRIAAIVDQHGRDALTAAMADVLVYSADKARQAFRSIPDGTYEFWDYLDDDYLSPLPVRLHVRLTVDDGRLHADFSATDPQVAAAFNLATGGRRHYQLTLRLAQYALTRDPSIPLNGGVLEPVSVTIPAGTILNPVFPAAVGIRHATSNRIFDVLNGALAQAVPDFMRAASSAVVIPVVLSEPPEDGGRRNVVVVEPMIGGTGAGFGLDGHDGRDGTVGSMQNNPVETVEAAADVVILRYGIRTDSGGPGRWRGGAGLELTFAPKRTGSQVLGRGAERLRFVPWGLSGGHAGAGCRIVKNYGRPDEQELGKIDVVDIEEGDIITVLTPGGGGFGDPFERDPAAVLIDVATGLVTAAAARRDYGVAIADGAVDTAETNRLRAGPAGRANIVDFDFGEERRKWDAVLHSTLMARINQVIFALPQARRLRARQEIFAPVAATLDRHRPIDLAQLRRAGAELERRLSLHQAQTGRTEQ